MSKKQSKKIPKRKTTNRKKVSKKTETLNQREKRLKRLKNNVLKRNKKNQQKKESKKSKVQIEKRSKTKAILFQNKKKNANKGNVLYMEGFNYKPSFDYSCTTEATIGKMNFICPYCQAFKFENEAPGMCCSNGKIGLDPLVSPPEPLLEYISGKTKLSKHFLTNICKYNGCVNMTSFGVQKKFNDQYLPTFKIQGQIHHSIGSLLPMTEGNEKFLQVYFLGNEESETEKRLENVPDLKREIISNIQNLLHKHNKLIKIFKSALENMPTDEYQIVLKAEEKPIPNIHPKRINVPTSNEVAIVIIGEEYGNRDIVVRRRDKSLKRINPTHQCYDALQYPLIFWRGENQYHFGLHHINTDKKVNF